MTTMTFQEEFNEVVIDVVADFTGTFEDFTSQELIDQLKEAVRVQIVTFGADPAELIRQLVSMQFVFMLIGREHQLRGYPSPIGRDPGQVSELARSVPDNIADLEA